MALKTVLNDFGYECIGEVRALFYQLHNDGTFSGNIMVNIYKSINGAKGDYLTNKVYSIDSPLTEDADLNPVMVKAGNTGDDFLKAEDWLIANTQDWASAVKV